MIGVVPKPDIKQSLAEATKAYVQQLSQDDEALTYLERRGITSEALDYFQLGVVREPMAGHEHFRGRLSIPYITPTGVVSIRFRTVGDPGDRSKVLVQEGDIQRLYNTRALLGQSEIYICEGETDTIAAWQAGLSAVGIGGAKAWQKYSHLYARIFANRNVTVLADNDDHGEGMEFAQDVYKTLGGCRILLMDEGHDVSSFVLEYGEEALRVKVER